MSDSFLRKFSPRPEGDSGIGIPAPGALEAEDLGCFAFLRGIRDRAFAVELRKKSGHILAISYSMIVKFEFEPSVGIMLHIGGGQLATIRGRNLNAEIRPNVRLFEGLTRWQVPWVQEVDRRQVFAASENGLLVEQIEW
jgi:hypothetical protein